MIGGPTIKVYTNKFYTENNYKYIQFYTPKVNKEFWLNFLSKVKLITTDNVFFA